MKIALRSVLSIYENGSSVKSVVGATPRFDLLASGQTPPDSPNGRLMSGGVLRQRHGSVVCRIALWLQARVGGADPYLGISQIGSFLPATRSAPPLAQDPDARYRSMAVSRVGVQPTARSSGQHESTIHLFAHAPRRMMSCSIVDDPEIVEGGRPNQTAGPKPRPRTASGTPALDLAPWGPRPPDDVAPDLRLARGPRRAGARAAVGPGHETRRSRSGPPA